MPTSSLNKVLFLKRQLAESQGSITLPSDNQRLNEALAAFNHRFEQIIAKMEAIAIDDVLSIDRTDQSTRQLFLESLNLNRGDHSKSRFLNTTLPKHAYLEDQISRLTKTFIETIEDENLSPSLSEVVKRKWMNCM